MKKVSFILAVICTLGSLQETFSQIAGTAHDFSSESWAPTSNRGCGVCHTTRQSVPVTSAPLWHHETTVVAGYTLYDSPTFDGRSTITDPGASSRLCLSCHDVHNRYVVLHLLKMSNVNSELCLTCHNK